MVIWNSKILIFAIVFALFKKKKVLRKPHVATVDQFKCSSLEEIKGLDKRHME